MMILVKYFVPMRSITLSSFLVYFDKLKVITHFFDIICSLFFAGSTIIVFNLFPNYHCSALIDLFFNKIRSYFTSSIWLSRLFNKMHTAERSVSLNDANFLGTNGLIFFKSLWCKNYNTEPLFKN